MKKDFLTFLILIFLAVPIFVLDLPTFARDLEDIGIHNEDIENIANLKVYNFKLDEEKFWKNIKGEEIYTSQKTTLAGSAYKSLSQKSEAEQKKLGLEAFKKIVPPLKILIIGDSFIESVFGPQLERDLLAYNGISVVRYGKIATGFNRNSETFNWTNNIGWLLSQNNPDVIIISLGANDVNPMLGMTFYQQEWRDEYSRRVGAFFEAIPAEYTHIYWIGHTISTNSIWNEGIVIIQDIFNNYIDSYANHKFINIWDKFTVNGAYAPYIENDLGVMIKVKDSDGIHFSQSGAEMLSRLVIETMKEDINFTP
jgi:hypothetical protein